ncbi:hypothetical protein ACOZE3_32915 [Streptomyces cinereoruber]|uniref:hypothetical protein n=1 Tax=Streptomyces cinereoruber TaxID=67260 RepID=UPI003BF4A167
MAATTGPAPRWPIPTNPPVHDPILFAQAMRDMRLTWRARGVLAELATGYDDGQEPTISALAGLTRKDRSAAEGREAFTKAVKELRHVGYLVPDAGTSTGVGERLLVDLAPAKDAHLVLDRWDHSTAEEGR